MIRPAGAQPAPEGFIAGGAVNIPWGLNVDGNGDVWVGAIVLLAGADPTGQTGRQVSGGITL